MKKALLGLLLMSSTLTAVAESKFSGELLLGTADQELSADGFDSTSGDDTSIGVRGTYNLTSNWGFEVSYHNYGEAQESYIDSFDDRINETLESTAINVGVKAGVPFNDAFSLYARLGISLWDFTYSVTDSSVPGEVFSAEDDGNDVYYGLGAQYNLSEKLFIGAEYTLTDLDANVFETSVNNEVKNISLSLGYKF